MTIIQEQTLYLSDQFEIIRQTIKTQESFSDLSSISSFNEYDKSITFKTEKIHPPKPPENTKPVILIFSNPHPVSVKSGMFLSEPYSRKFWERVFACECMQPSRDLIDSISHWSSSTIDTLSTNLLHPTYSNQVTLFFDCLESLPTNQYNDLKKIFRKKEGNELRNKILQKPGVEHLIDISKKNHINTWIIFSAEAYRYIVGSSTVAKYAPTRIKNAIDKYQIEGDIKRFWLYLHDLKETVVINGFEISVYLTLIARRKNDMAPDGKRYFTLMLDQIFSDITT